MRNKENKKTEAVDFSGGVRGKYAKSYRRGHTVRITQEDGSIIVQKFLPDENSVVLDDDVRAYFKDSTEVNKALRALIGIIQPHRKKALRQ